MMFESGTKKLGAHVKDNEGLLLIITAEAFFVFMGVSVKLFGTEISVEEILWIQMVATYISSVAYMYYAKIDDPVLGPPGVRILLTLRGLAGYLGIFGFYCSVQYLPLADAMALTAISPLFTAILKALLLKEKIGIKEASTAIMSLIGATFIARPPFLFNCVKHRPKMTINEHKMAQHPSQRVIAVGIALLGAIGAAIAHTINRIIGKRAHPLHVNIYFAKLCVAAATISMVVIKTPIILPSQGSFVGLLLLVTIFGMISQTLMTMGHQHGDPGRTSMGVCSGVIFGLVLGKTVFKTNPDVMSFAGTVMILGSALFIAPTKVVSEEKARGRVPNEENGDVQVPLLEVNEEREDELASGR